MLVLQLPDIIADFNCPMPRYGTLEKASQGSPCDQTVNGSPSEIDEPPGSIRVRFFEIDSRVHVCGYRRTVGTNWPDLLVNLEIYDIGQVDTNFKGLLELPDMDTVRKTYGAISNFCEGWVRVSEVGNIAVFVCLNGNTNRL